MKKYLLLAFALLMLSARLPAQDSVSANLTAATTTCLVSSSCLVAKVLPNNGGATFELTGTMNVVIQFEASADPLTVLVNDAHWVALSVNPSDGTAAVTSTTQSGSNLSLAWQANVSGFRRVRMRVSTYTSGTASATINTSTASAKAGGVGGGGGGAIVSCSTSGGILYENGTANTATCSPNFEWFDAGTYGTLVAAGAGVLTSNGDLTGNNYGFIVPSTGTVGTVNSGYAGIVSNAEITNTMGTSDNPGARYTGVAGEGDVEGTGTVTQVTGVLGIGAISAFNGNSATATTMDGFSAYLNIGAAGGHAGVGGTTGNDYHAESPKYEATTTPPTETNGLLIENMGNAAWASNGIHIKAQTSPGKGIVVDGGGIYGDALFCGVLNTTSCVFTGYGGTSGTATLTWPAVAGTTTNPINFSNYVSSGTDNSVAGGFQVANSAANAHTIFGSAATTTNTILGFATVPTTGHLVTCTVASTICTLTDGGAVPTGTVTSVATTAPLGGGTITTTGTLTCTTCVTSAASLANGGVVLGTAGTQASATNTQLTFSAPTLTVGLAGTSSGILALTGSTSGSATFTAPATAGTRTNPVISSNYFQIGVAGTTSGELLLAGSTSGTATILAPATAGTATNAIQISNSLQLPSGTVYGWNGDTGFSRLGAGVIVVGNGTNGDYSGTVDATTFKFGSLANLNSGNVLYSNSAPTISSGFGSTPSIPTSNGTASFSVNVGTGGAASSGVITMPTAATGWHCFVAPNGAPQAAAVTYSAPTSASSITLTNYTLTTGIALAWTASTVLQVSCWGY